MYIAGICTYLPGTLNFHRLVDEAACFL